MLNQDGNTNSSAQNARPFVLVLRHQMHTSSYTIGNCSARTVENVSLCLDRTNFILTLTRMASLNATLANTHLHSKGSWISICTVTLPLDNITARKLAVIKASVMNMT